MLHRISVASLLVVTLACLFPPSARCAEEGARVISYYGYDDCILLENSQTRVVLCPAAGGRVLEYSTDGKNALYLPPGNEGWTYEPGRRGGNMTAGRFDVGPEQTIPRHPQLWAGRWKGEIVGPRAARLTSVKDEPTGIRLIREFVLDDNSTFLACVQTIENVSDRTVEYCYWSRTFALGGGICVIPLTEPSRFPNGYVMYESSSTMNFRPEDPNIRRRDGFLEILAAPKHPKLGMDTKAGWFAYLMPNDLMFVKRFPVYEDRVYNEVAALTMSIWYPDRPMCELEPIGPREKLEPGESAAFGVSWGLLPRAFPKEGEQVDLQAVAGQVKQAMEEADRD